MADAALEAAKATISAKGEEEEEMRAHERYVALQKKASDIMYRVHKNATVGLHHHHG